MDTSLFPPLVVLALAALMLLLLAAAEAAVIEVARRRVRGQAFAGLDGLLRAYVAERLRLRRGLRFGIATATVAITACAIVLLTDAGLVRAAIAALVALVAVTLLRAVAAQVAGAAPEAAARRLHVPVAVVQMELLPLDSMVRVPAAMLLRVLGVRGRPEATDPAEELIGLLEATDEEEGALLEERRMMRGVLEMSGQTVRELMTPRTDVTAIPLDASIADAVRMVADSGYSRIPLYEETVDRIVGVIYAKDLLAYVGNSADRPGGGTPPLTSIARPPYLVPETKRANDLLADLRRDKVHMAIAVDEYGGTAGVITVEDLVEEIVGAITDEYDTVATEVQRISDSEAIVDAGLTIDELNDLFGTEIVADDFDTVGGLIVTSLGRLALPGDDVIAPRLEEDDRDVRQLELRVLTILGRRIKNVRVQRHLPAEESAAPAAEAV